MITRCKFMCDGTAVQGGGANRYYEAWFTPVGGGTEENKEFFKWSPNGRFQLAGLKNQPFEAGKQYYLGITEAQ